MDRFNNMVERTEERILNLETIQDEAQSHATRPHQAGPGDAKHKKTQETWKIQ